MAAGAVTQLGASPSLSRSPGVRSNGRKVSLSEERTKLWGPLSRLPHRANAAYALPTDIMVGGIGCRLEKKDGEHPAHRQFCAQVAQGLSAPVLRFMTCASFRGQGSALHPDSGGSRAVPRQGSWCAPIHADVIDSI